MSSTPAPQPVGALLRGWRRQRRFSQLELACEAEISQRHLSFVESGRAAPSRDMVLRLCDHLDLPLRERNALLLSAGYAPLFRERALTDPALAQAREALALILKGHEPFPALVIDRHWTMVSANAAVPPLLDGVEAKLLAPPVNVLRLSLHPAGLAPRIVNLGQWRAHLLERLRRQSRLTLDPVIADLLRELEGYPCPDTAEPTAAGDVAIPFVLRVGDRTLSFLSTTTLFGTPTEVTLSELALEAFYPADAATAAAMRG